MLGRTSSDADAARSSRKRRAAGAEQGATPFSLSLDGHQERVALLATVVHHDVDMRVVLRHPSLRAIGDVTGVLATDQGDQLATGRQQPVEYGDRDLAEVVTDDREVPCDHAEHVARAARTGG